jgi:SAM-dependent methyltransferase
MQESMPTFTCNICGAVNTGAAGTLAREEPSCRSCGSNVRTRGLLQALSLSLFGTNLTLPDFPRVKSLRGLGTSDSNDYAVRLAEKFDYRNTYYDREPRFDITNPLETELGVYDFLLSSEVFEHVPPPPEAAFRNAFRMLKPSGVLVFTVPYSLEASMREHYPGLLHFGFVELDGRLVLVNRTRTGELQFFENPVFHRSNEGEALEAREFNEQGLKAILADAGFSEIRLHGDDYAPFGIVRSESWSLPITARKGPFAFSLDATRDVMEEWRTFKLGFNAEMRRLDRALWFRVGRRLGLI